MKMNVIGKIISVILELNRVIPIVQECIRILHSFIQDLLGLIRPSSITEPPTTEEEIAENGSTGDKNGN